MDLSKDDLLGDILQDLHSEVGVASFIMQDYLIIKLNLVKTNAHRHLGFGFYLMFYE